MPKNAPTNGNHGKEQRSLTIKQRGAILGQKRVPASRNDTKGGDDPKSRDGGRKR